MKIMHLKNKRLWTTTSLSRTLLATAGTALAGFQYSPGDLLVGLRLDGGGTHELLVAAGSITNFLKLSAGQSLTVANLTQGLLTDAFPGGLNDLKFATFADTTTGTIVVGSSNYPPHTLWMSGPRPDLNTQSAPYFRLTFIGAGNVIAQIEGLGLRSVAYGSGIPTGPDNTSTGILLAPGAIPPPLNSYSTYIGSGNFNATFGGIVEQTTPATFTTDGLPVRSDLYVLTPDTSAYADPAIYLGYFELSTNGVLKYTAGPSAITIPQPQIISITRTGGTAAVTFGPTVGSASYSLLGSSDLTTPVSGWSAIGAPVAGTGSNLTINDTTSSTQKFYLIKAQ